MLPARLSVAIALALLIAPSVAAQTPVVPEPDPQDAEAPPEAQQQFDCQAPFESCVPDLLPTNPRADFSDERFPGQVCADFINLGDGPTAVPFLYHFAIDGIGIGDRQFSKVYRRGEGEYAVCFQDVTLNAGRHTLTITIDADERIAESNETNNVRALAFLVRPTPRTDLHLSTFRVTPKEGGAGMNQIFIINVTNVGNDVSTPTTVDLTDEGKPMASWSLPALQPGRTATFAHATRPELRPVGTFVARAVVDPLNNVSERNEANNEALLEYTVLDHPAPDYAFKNVSIQGNRTELRGVRVDVTVENLGDRTVRGTLVRVVNQTNVTLVQGLTTSLIFPQQTALLQFILVLPAGEHQFRLIADPYGLVGERNESNNVHEFNVTIEEHVEAIDRPNLLVERVYAMPEDPRPGEPISVGGLIHNVGTNTSQPTTINFSVAGRTIGSANVPALKPGAYYSAYVPWIGGESNTYTITAFVDAADKEVELDEGDNALSLQFLVTSVKPPEDEEPPNGPDPQQPEPPPVTPTPPPTPPPTTPTTPPTTPTGPRVALGDLIVATRAVPGGVKGVVSASLRNPNIAPLGLVSVRFTVDGELLKDVIVRGIPGAGTAAATTGEVDLPEGKHELKAEVRIVNERDAPIVRTAEYEAEAEKTGLPGFEAAFALAAVALAFVFRRRRA